jgi:hypothetical protein
MKKLGILVIALAFTFVANAQSSIKFAVMEYNFGKIKQNKPAKYKFKFTNISKAPLSIETASASCGCTTPVWPKAPVMPGKSNVIEAGYDAKSLGAFTKTISVSVHGMKTPVTLTIKGEVVK